MDRSRWIVVSLIGMAAVCGLPLRAQTSPLDASAYIKQQDAALGARPGTITLQHAARLGESVTLGPGHNLLIRAPLTVAGGASIQLRGHNQVRCAAPITVENTTDLFLADGVTDVSVAGCEVNVTGRVGGYLLTATRSTHVTETGNHLTNMAIFTTHNPGRALGETTDVTITGNSTHFVAQSGYIGVYLMYVLHGTVSNNSFYGTGHGVEWWGGDANQGWPGFDQVNAASDLTISGNQCDRAGGACVWGSDGVDIQVTNNTAAFCGDVCFDTEGGVRTLFTGNTARVCGNGCFAAEFESQDVTFRANTGYGDAPAKMPVMVLIKHPSGRVPDHRNLSVTGNTFRCSVLCTAFYSEGVDGLTLSGNNVLNGNFASINYSENALIHGNTLRFTLPLGALVGINGPGIANGQHSEISDNQITSTAPVTPDSVCIAQGWSDYNNTDQMRLVNNTCAGFGHGIVTATSGGNPGAPHAVWYIQGNHFLNIPPALEISHIHTSGNEVYTNVPGA